MSWTYIENPYQRFAKACRYDLSQPPPIPRHFPVTIFEANNGPDHFGAQKVVENKNFEPSMIRRRADLRIIIAPVDSLRPNCAPGMIELCRELVIPHEFLNERIQGVGHSFGTRADGRHGFAAWFRYLCKSIDTESNLLHHRWYKSAFYLKKDQEFAGGGITLVMFGPTPAVTRRIEACITTTAWLDVLSEPFVLFDLVLDALFSETDLTVWRLLDVIHDLEKQVLEAARNAQGKRNTEQIDFSELHGWTRNLVNMSQVIDSCLMVVDSTLAAIGRQKESREKYRRLRMMVDEREGDDPIRDHLRESLLYRRSLFSSTRLRLTSLQQHVTNTTNLAFHLVTQQDSRLMVRDSASMIVISFLTVIFLPTVSVATVMGSELFQTNFHSSAGTEPGTVEILTSPLFKTLWIIAIPITVVITGFAMAYRMWVMSEKKPPMTNRVRRNAKKVEELWEQTDEVKELREKYATGPSAPWSADDEDPDIQGLLPFWIPRITSVVPLDRDPPPKQPPQSEELKSPSPGLSVSNWLPGSSVTMNAQQNPPSLSDRLPSQSPVMFEQYGPPTRPGTIVNPTQSPPPQSKDLAPQSLAAFGPKGPSTNSGTIITFPQNPPPQSETLPPQTPVEAESIGPSEAPENIGNSLQRPTVSDRYESFHYRSPAVLKPDGRPSDQEEIERLRGKFAHLRPQDASPSDPGSAFSYSKTPTAMYEPWGSTEASMQQESPIRWPFGTTGSPDPESDDEGNRTTTETYNGYTHAVDITPRDGPVELGGAPAMSVREGGTWARPPRAHARRRSRERRTGRTTPFGVGGVRRYTPVSGRNMPNMSPVVWDLVQRNLRTCSPEPPRS